MKQITIHYDSDAESPREWDNLGAFYVPKENRYVQGDKDAELPGLELVSDAELVAWACAELDKDDLHECARNRYDKRNGYTKADAIRCMVEGWYSDFTEYPESLQEIIGTHCVIVPVYAYVHGGVALNTGGFSCLWDSRQVGFIWCSLERVKSEYGDTEPESIERARKRMCGEIKTLDMVYQGAVYGYTIEDEENPENDDSGWGFIGWDIDECGMLEHIPDELHDAARRAFEVVGTPVTVGKPV